MSYVVTKLSPGMAYRHGHWPWVHFINIDVGQADHDCPRRGEGTRINHFWTSLESPKRDKSTGRETLGGAPQRSSSAPGRIGPAGNPGRQGLGGSDSSSKASLLGCLIVRDEGPTAKDDGDQHLPDVGAEEPKDKPMDEKEGGSENEGVFGGDSPKNVEGLFSTPLSPLRKLIRAPWNLIILSWRDSRLPARQILGRGAKRPRFGKGLAKVLRAVKGSKHWRWQGDWQWQTR